LQSRFFVLAIPVCALMIAEGLKLSPHPGPPLFEPEPQSRRPEYQGRGWGVAATVAAVLLAVFTFSQMHPRVMKFVRFDRDQLALIGKENLSGLKMDDPAKFPPKMNLALVGDAEAFWYPLPMSRLFYKTVFDVDTGDPNASIIDDWLKGIPFDQFRTQVDREELDRFHRTYYKIPALDQKQ
jgi:hypothetical protein